MSGIDVGIRGNDGIHHAGVTENGELIVGSLAYSDPYYQLLAVADTGVEVVPAVTSRCFVITGVLIASTKNFASATVAETVTIYEANPADITTNTKTVFQIDLLRNDRLVAFSLNLRVSSTKTLVAIATDAEVNVTLAGYYVKC